MSRVESTGAAGAPSQSLQQTGTPAERLRAALEMKVPKGDRQATRLRLGAIFNVLNSMSTREANDLFNEINTSGSSLRGLLEYKLSKPMQKQVHEKIVDLAILEVRRPVRWEKMWPLDKDEVALLNGRQQSSLAKAMAPRPNHAPPPPAAEPPGEATGSANRADGKTLGEAVREQVAKTKQEHAETHELGDVVREQMQKTKDEIAEADKPIADTIRDQVAKTQAELRARAARERKV